MNNMFSIADFIIDPPSLLIGGVAGFICAFAFMLIWVFALAQKKAALEARLESERSSLENHFKVLAADTLKSNAESFLTLAQEKLKNAQADAAHDLDKRSTAISQMVKPVETTLTQLKTAVDQLQATDKTIREDLQNLSRETSRLTGALKNPAAQGKWGEFVLERLLDKAHLVKGLHYETQVTVTGPDGGRLRPDVIIRLQDGFNIIIDAKAPIGEFISRMEDEGRDDAELKKNLARAVRNHVKALGGKAYWDQLDSPDFVVLFLPSEHIFSTALTADPDLVDFAAEHQVVIASPTLMLSLLRVVGMSWRQVELAKNAQDISRLGSELFDRIFSFAGHLDKVGKGIEGALGAYNKAVGVLESRVLVSARKLKDLHAAQAGKELDAPRMLDSAPRALTDAGDPLDQKDEKETDRKYG